MQPTQFYYTRNNQLFLVVILFLFTACAQIVNPTGGPKDMTPPKMTKVFPSINSLNINQNSPIKITFDEYVEINNPGERVLVSPPLKNAPTYKVDGKSLVVRLNDTLKANTTYTLFFDNCIRDITEGNAIPAFEYMFSTGNTIDSNSIRGTVYDAFTFQPEKQVYVMLYKENIDSLPRVQKPYYISKTGDQGDFAFLHISPGDFKIFTLADKNGNLLFDQFSERIGFSNGTISSKSGEPVILGMFTQADTAQRILRASVVGLGKVMVSFRKAATDLHIKMKNGLFEERFITEISKGADSVFLYDRYLLPDTVTLYVADQNVFDTLVLSPSVERKSIRKGGKSVSENQLVVLDGKERYQPVRVVSGYPVKTLNQKRISLLKVARDTTLVSFTVSATDSVHKEFSLLFDKQEQETYLLRILDSAFIGYNNRANDTVISQFTVLTENDYGSLQIGLENVRKKPLLVQLVDEQGAVLNQASCENSAQISWKNISPGSYQLRAIVDENRNGKWDSGNYFAKQQPEQIRIFATHIQIRAKWDLEEKFVVN